MSSKKSADNHNIGILDKDKNKVSKPKKYKVVLHNDDFTPMDFVVVLIHYIFKRDTATAYKLMLDIHEKGKGVMGVYSKEIADTKSSRCNAVARESGYPLKSSVEPA